MGKRARIAKVNEMGEVQSIHIQYANTWTFGLALQIFFNDEQDIDNLMQMGHLDSLSVLEGKPEDYESEYTKNNFGKIIVLPEDKIINQNEDGFIRVRIRNEASPDVNTNYKEFCKTGYDMERAFIFWQDKWWLSCNEFPKLVLLESVLEMIQAPSPDLD